MPLLDDATCHAATEARDHRHDGQFFTGVVSTGVYCRCVCPARTPKRENRRFFPSAAAAERAGFRPCLVCRPELAPGASPLDATLRVAHAAIRRIEAGALEGRSLADLAAELGVSDRHLRRALVKTFGASPIDIAQTHRLLTAKRLLHETRLSLIEVASAAGFGSVRRFNAVFLSRYGLAPSHFRAPGVRAGRGAEARAGAPATARLSFVLAPRGPFDGVGPLAHAERRRVARMEAAPYLRTFAVAGCSGVLTLALGAGPAPVLTLTDGLLPAFRQVIAAVRGALDLDADVEVINAALGRAPDLAADVRANPTVRLPGALDPFELAIRAILGQQVTVQAATTLAARLVEAIGAPIDTGIVGLDRLFPTPARLAEAGAERVGRLGMPRARAEAVVRLAAATADGTLALARGAVAGGRAALASLPGVGPWTLEYIALRGLGDPDGFPVGDAGLRLAFPGDLRRASEAWRPWRGYAAAHLWQRHARRDPTAPTARAAPTRTRTRAAAHPIPKGAVHAPASPPAFRAP
jgi:AraC family transcriptional regulator, regulatory protein of adaptative response / DNA-3-methyladenine glycosylase II